MFTYGEGPSPAKRPAGEWDVSTPARPGMLTGHAGASWYTTIPRRYQLKNNPARLKRCFYRPSLPCTALGLFLQRSMASMPKKFHLPKGRENGWKRGGGAGEKGERVRGTRGGGGVMGG